MDHHHNVFLFRNRLIWKVFILHLIQEFLEKIENVYFCQGRELNFLLFGHKYNYWKEMFSESEWLYLGPGAKYGGNKGTFFSRTLKVGGKKVPLLFWFFAPRPRYGHSVSKTIFFRKLYFTSKARNSVCFLDKNRHFLFFLGTLK